MKLTHDILERLDQLEEKYGVMGQDMLSYLDGLLYADYLTYWDYIHLDTLLSLQRPKTSFPDENIFIIYHQITELYFKLILQAIEQLSSSAERSEALFIRQLERINRYTSMLVDSFGVMVNGMDRDEFLQFRMSLLPSSGFQSGQFRKIEIWSTDLHRLVHTSLRDELQADHSIADLYQGLYWRSGATELASGKKTLTLRQFEQKYAHEFQELAKSTAQSNLWQCYLQLRPSAEAAEKIRHLLREYDHKINVGWRLAHLRSAVRYLENKPKVIKATGGTNWQQYLPPRQQQVVFFPELWSAEELEKWGTEMRS
jgi:tryptophan 2,3-dioxygenase